jgi:hypothetical protein
MEYICRHAELVTLQVHTLAYLIIVPFGYLTDESPG